MNPLVKYYVLQVEARIYTSNGYLGFKTTKEKIYLNRRMKLGWKIVSLGLNIINQGKCEVLEKDGDG